MAGQAKLVGTVERLERKVDILKGTVDQIDDNLLALRSTPEDRGVLPPEEPGDTEPMAAGVV